ncbi:hypothetical protein GC194_01620 [bacterium]|nr:hypothetical protein [bacterium]
MDETICMGWDVGGMHGANNALAVLHNCAEKPEIAALISFKKPKTAEALAQQIADEILSAAAPGSICLLAIDAPLRFPPAFVAQMKHLDHIKPLSFTRQIDNPLAYRSSETYLFDTTGKRPLSSTFDQLTSLTLLVLRVFSIIKERGAHLNTLPYDGLQTTVGINAFECYPGNLKPGKTERIAQQTFWQWAQSFLKTAHTMHEKDALLCALFSSFEMNKPETERFHISSDFKSKAQENGWIYGFY